VRQVRLIVDGLLLPGLEQTYEDALPLGEWADVVVGHFLQPAARMVAERLARPFVSGTLDPSQLATRCHPPEKLPNLGGTGNRLLWKLSFAVLNAGTRDGINRVRVRVGLPPLADYYGDDFYGPALNLVAVSRLVVAEPTDWVPRHRMTGYWFLREERWEPPSSVAEFLSREPRPIAIGFGSMLTEDSVALTQLLIGAVRRSGVRAVIEPGSAGLAGGELPPTMLRVTDVPHAWLFDQVSAVVHHGGAGTTAATLRAGVPSVVVPHVFDQFYWAARTRRLGVGPRAVPRRRLTEEGLASAISLAVGDTALRERAAALGAQIRGEDGPAEAIRLVESYARAA
jgi:UDP:flavonoid glycosyltransferase YjiC (YdhE family)